MVIIQLFTITKARNASRRTMETPVITVIEYRSLFQTVSSRWRWRISVVRVASQPLSKTLCPRSSIGMRNIIERGILFRVIGFSLQRKFTVLLCSSTHGVHLSLSYLYLSFLFFSLSSRRAMGSLSLFHSAPVATAALRFLVLVC